MTDKRFVHLRVHSEFSIVDGLLRVSELSSLPLGPAMPAMAITDRSNVFGLVKWYRALRRQGVKPLIGAELRIEEIPGTSTYTHAVVLCKNDIGFLNFKQLLSKAYQEGNRETDPIIPFEWLKSRGEGLIVLSGALDSGIARSLLAGRAEEAQFIAERWAATFPGRFYLEVQRVGRDEESAYVAGLIPLAQKLALPLVATNAVRFARASDHEAHEARVCIQEGMTLDHPGRKPAATEEQYVKSAEQMHALFEDIPSALTNAVHIAERCSVEMTLGNAVFPKFPIPDGMTDSSYLEKCARDGLVERLNTLFPDPALRAEKASEYEARLELEMGVIHRMGFDGYFLIVADFIQWAIQQGIPVGPGRGSGAGSIVAYALQITNLDPIQYELLFERFLNPERVSLPDFDIDFCMDQRDRVIEYVAEHYGRDQVSQIATFGTMAAKAVVRDVGRVLGHPYGFVDKIAKLIPFELGMTLKKALEQEESLKQRYDDEDEVRTLIDLARKLEGLTRNVGKHAGGVVIAPGPITDFSPLYTESLGAKPVTQFDKDDAESAGLIKFDFLGLRTLTIIDWAVTTINAQATTDPVDINQIPLDSERVFQLLKACETTAVFQLESRGMKDLIRRLQPDRFEEIIALVALFRPGPLQSGMVDDYIERKHGRQKVAYPHPLLESILKPTYGVILYQEQVMQIAQVLAGYSLGAADLLRRAMGKKKPEEMAKQREIFVSGSVDNGVDEKQAAAIFDLMEKFAGYGFNKSHSAAYAYVSYQTAWLKAHYPDAFMAAVLSSDMNHTDKLVGMIQECQSMRLTILPPSVQHSVLRFTVTDKAGTIRYGLGAIKGVGEGPIQAIVEARAERPYVDLFDFCARMSPYKVNRRTLESLIYAGALDELGENRATLMANLEEAIRSAEQAHTAAASGQTDLFGNTPAAQTPDRRTTAEWPLLEKLKNEKDALGFYFSDHPRTCFQEELSALVPHSLDAVRRSDKKQRVAGFVQQVKTMLSRKGERIAFVTLEDGRGTMEIALFADVYQAAKNALSKDELVIVEGTVGIDERSQQPRMRATTCYPLEQARLKLASYVSVHVNDLPTALPTLQSILEAYQPPDDGQGVSVRLQVRSGKYRVRVRLGPEWTLLPTQSALQDLAQSFGESAVQIHYEKRGQRVPAGQV